VCATYRRPDAVARLLTALAAQDLERPFEVVLVDDGSGPDDVSRLREVVASSPLAVTLLLQERNAGAAAARNRGWAAAAAPVVAFTDDDCQPDPSWLREGLAALEPGIGAVVGRVRPNPDQADNARGWSRSLVVEDARYFQTANAFYRRADLERVGGFDPRLARGGEDTDLGLRVVEQVGPVRFAPEALVLHDVRPASPWQLARESATRWVDLPLVLKKHPQLRRLVMHRRLFWKPSHPPTILAVLGILVAPWQPWALLLTAFWVGARRRVSPRRLPGTFLIDVAEVVACLRGSLKHRVVVL
jgi:GT2 family glycosyltransferase